MKEMTNADLEKGLSRALNAITPDRAQKIWETPVEKATGTEWYLNGLYGIQGKRAKNSRLIMSVAAILLLLLVPFYQLFGKVDACIYLDVNPSIELEIDRGRHVIRVDAKNEDGIQILDGMNLKRTELKVAMNAIIGSMVRNGFLTEANNVILLSVDGKNEERTNALRKDLSAEIKAYVQTLNSSGLVLNQSVHNNKTLAELAKEYGISEGKIKLLRAICRLEPGLNIEELAKLSMDDLFQTLQNQGVDLHELIDSEGSILDDDWEDDVWDDLTDIHDQVDVDDRDYGDDDRDDIDDREDADDRDYGDGDRDDIDDQVDVDDRDYSDDDRDDIDDREDTDDREDVDDRDYGDDDRDNIDDREDTDDRDDDDDDWDDHHDRSPAIRHQLTEQNQTSELHESGKKASGRNSEYDDDDRDDNDDDDDDHHDRNTMIYQPAIHGQSAVQSDPGGRQSDGSHPNRSNDHDDDDWDDDDDD